MFLLISMMPFNTSVDSVPSAPMTEARSNTAFRPFSWLESSAIRERMLSNVCPAMLMSWLLMSALLSHGALENQ